MHDNVFKVLAVNFQPIPDLRNVIEGSNELIFLMWVAVTLPSNEVRTSSVARECYHFDWPCIIINCIKRISGWIIECEIKSNYFHMITKYLTSHQSAGFFFHLFESPFGLNKRVYLCHIADLGSNVWENEI